MRYLDKRSEFLNKVNEGGPFHNDIGWNDSLLGRLINHSIRKLKIQMKVGDVKNLVKKLNAEFENIISENQLENSSENVKIIANKAKSYLLFKNLIDAVDRGESVKNLIKMTDDTISSVKSMSEFDDKEDILKELEEFKNFLESKENEDSNESENADGSENVDGSDSEENSENADGSEKDKSYVYMIRNLKALSLILSNYSKVKVVEKDKSNVNDDIIGKEFKYKGKIVKVVNTQTTQKAGADEKWLTQDDVKGSEKIYPNVFVVFKDIATNTYPADAKTATVSRDDLLSLTNEATTFSTGGSKERNSVVDGEDHSTQALAKLNKDISSLISSKEKGISINSDFINSIVDKSVNSDTKVLVKKLYKEIVSYLVGNKKLTLQERDPLFKESVDILQDNNKIIVVAEKIARFSKRALQFDGQNLYGSLGDLGKPLKDFVDTIKPFIRNKEEKNESIITYNDFILIREAEGQSDVNVSKEDEIKSIKEQVKIYFDENCVKVKSYTIDDSEVIKASNEMENSKVNENEVTFGPDAVIEIIRLFNKAYKTYTVQTITKRSENVGTRTLAEYTNFGGGNSGESGRSGPYRNNKLFNIWESGVYDIMANRKYQAIFTKFASLKIPKVTNPQSKEDFEIKKGAGQNLRTFINKMLDGDEIYRSGSKEGSINTMLEKYFGDSVNIDGKKDINQDIESNTILGEQIYEKSKKLKFSKLETKPLNRSFFILDCSIDNENSKQRTFYINTLNNGEVYLTFSSSFSKVSKIIEVTKNTKFNIDKGDFSRELFNSDEPFRYTKMSVEDFKKFMTPGSTITLNSYINSSSTIKTNKLTINNIYWLTDVKTSKLYTIPLEDAKAGLQSIYKRLKEDETPVKTIQGKDNKIKTIGV